MAASKKSARDRALTALAETPNRWQVFKHDDADSAAKLEAALGDKEGIRVRRSGRVVHAKQLR